MLQEINKNGTQTWRDEEEGQYRHRKVILAIIINMLKAESVPLYMKEMLEGTTVIQLAQKLEYLLFHKAGSLQEFITIRTISRRIQYLALFSSRYKKRSRGASKSSHGKLKRQKSIDLKAPDSSFWLSSSHLHIPDEVTQHIFGFLENSTVIEMRAINRHAATCLAKVITSLKLSSSVLERVLLRQSAYDFLESFPRLEAIEMHNDLSSDFAQAVTSDGNACDRMLTEFSAALESRACPRLRHLAIRSFFFQASQTNVAGILMRALAASCGEIQTVDLTANFLGDAGAFQVASFLASGACQSLTKFQLNKNFIGQVGAESIGDALVSCPRRNLKAIGLSGNVLTSKCLLKLTNAISMGNSKDLEFLDLENNFISSSGICKLVESIKVGSPKFQRVKLAGNSYSWKSLNETNEFSSLLRSQRFSVELNPQA